MRMCPEGRGQVQWGEGPWLGWPAEDLWGGAVVVDLPGWGFGAWGWWLEVWHYHVSLVGHQEEQEWVVWP